MTARQQAAVDVRWMIRRDLAAVVAIERADGDGWNDWTEDDFVAALRERNVIGLVAEAPGPDGAIVGFIVYRLRRKSFEVVRLAVATAWRRRSIGCRLLGKLVDKLTLVRRRWIDVVVDERNLAALLFLRSLDFRAIAIEPPPGCGDDDVIRMRFTIAD